MPARSKGARLHLRPARGPRRAHWVILDDGHESSTGCGEHDRAGAETKLGVYLAKKHLAQATAPQNPKDPASIPVATVIALYAKDVAPTTARPKETATRLEFLLAGFEGKTLADINGELCRAYGKGKTSSAARRQLEDLRSAINYHRQEGHCDRLVGIALPEKPKRRERWLTRAEVADVIYKAWRYREIQKGVVTGRKPRQHTAKFMLVAFYTGRRAGAICAASFHKTPGYGYVDVDAGVLYPRDDLRVSKKRQPPQPLPDRLLVHLRRWKRRQRFVVEYEGAPIKRITKSHDQAVGAAELENVTPHTWRHTAATHQMQAGTPLWEAAGYLGMTEKQLEDGYGHHHPQFMERARNAMNRRKA